LEDIENSKKVLLAEFKSLGISSDEGQAYLSLLQKDSVTGYQLSKSTGVPSSKIYSILSKLLERGFIVSTCTKPVKYFPCAPDVVSAKLRGQYDKSLDRLEDALKTIPRDDTTRQVLAWNLTTRAEVMAKARGVLENSTDSILLAIWPKELRPIRAALRNAFTRGVKLTTVTYGATNLKEGNLYYHRPSDFPFRERGERRFVLTSDDRMAVIANFKSDGLGSGLWTENVGLVRLFRDFIVHEVIIIMVENAFPEPIKEFFGKDWEKLYNLPRQ